MTCDSNYTFFSLNSPAIGKEKDGEKRERERERERKREKKLNSIQIILYFVYSLLNWAPISDQEGMTTRLVINLGLSFESWAMTEMEATARQAFILEQIDRTMKACL
jgi:hypothetical protein